MLSMIVEIMIIETEFVLPGATSIFLWEKVDFKTAILKKLVFFFFNHYYTVIFHDTIACYRKLINWRDVFFTLKIDSLLISSSLCRFSLLLCLQ